MASALSEVVDGYVELGNYLVDRWRDHAANIAAKVEGPQYGADDAVNDLGATTSLAAQSGFLIVSEAFDALAILTGRQSQPYSVDSDVFDSPLPGATLALAGPLTNGFSSPLPASAVTIDPTKLDQGQTRFRLQVNATGQRAGTYVGQVQASDGAAMQLVDVWVTVA
jgi:hypothetical protein